MRILQAIRNIRYLSILILFSILAPSMTHTVHNWHNGVGPNQHHCPMPSENVLKCLNEWVCQSVINLDLRCLLNVNGQPLLKRLLNTLNGLSDSDSGFPLLGPILGR